MEFLFVSFRSVPFLYVCWFRFEFSHKPKSMRPDGRPLFFFSRPRPNVSRLRRPGAARAQPWDDIKLAMKRKEVTLMVLTDFSKVFDTVCFKTTLKKLYKLGFFKNYLKWLLSYLSGGTQFVQIDDTKSHHKLSQFGIPQGSILGPMIFNLYVSDLRDNLDLSTSCSQYADDTSLYTHCAVRELESTTCDLNESLTKLGSWS